MPLIALHTSLMCDSTTPVRCSPSKQPGGNRATASAELPFPHNRLPAYTVGYSSYPQPLSRMPIFYTIVSGLSIPQCVKNALKFKFIHFYEKGVRKRAFVQQIANKIFSWSVRCRNRRRRTKGIDAPNAVFFRQSCSKPQRSVHLNQAILLRQTQKPESFAGD